MGGMDSHFRNVNALKLLVYEWEAWIHISET
jgi:hypothetical protein